MENNNILTGNKVYNGNENSDTSLDSSIIYSHKSIEKLLWLSSPEMYRESLESLFEAWILSDNFPDGDERDGIYCHYKYLMQFLNQITAAHGAKQQN